MKKLILLALLACLPNLALASGGCKSDYVQTQNNVGAIIPVAGAKVRVCAYSDTAQPCTPLTLYSDPSLSVALANPITTDARGKYAYCAATGNYNEQISGTGIVGANNQPVTLGGGDSVDLSAPGPIGGTTPAQGKFTDLLTKVSPMANIRAGGNSANHLHFVCAPGAVIMGGSQILSGGEDAGIFHLGYSGSNVNNISGYAAGTIAKIGASSITLTTHANASNFVQGDVIYMRGDVGQDGQQFGEFNYVASSNATTGVVTLVRPLSLPYPTVLTAVNGTSAVERDVSIEGCEVHSRGDFAFIGQVIGTKIKDNRWFAYNGTWRGSLVNSYEPLSDIEVTGNYWQGDPSATSFFIQVATGWSNWRITNNVVIAGSASPLEITEGASDGQIVGNSIYSVGTTNTPLSFCQKAYGVQVTGNLFMASGGANGVDLSCSSGEAVNSTFSGNTVITDGATATAVKGGVAMPIVGNTITAKYVGIGVTGATAITGNTIHLTDTNGGGYGIFDNTGTAKLTIQGNTIYGDTVGAGGSCGINIGASGENSSVIGNHFDTLTSAVCPQWQTTMASFGNTCSSVTNAESTCHDIFGLQGQVWLTNNWAKSAGVLGLDGDIDLDTGKNFKVNGAAAKTTVNGVDCALGSTCTVSASDTSGVIGQTLQRGSSAYAASFASPFYSTLGAIIVGDSWMVGGGAAQPAQGLGNVVCSKVGGVCNVHLAGYGGARRDSSCEQGVVCKRYGQRHGSGVHYYSRHPCVLLYDYRYLVDVHDWRGNQSRCGVVGGGQQRRSRQPVYRRRRGYGHSQCIRSEQHRHLHREHYPDHL